MSLRKHTADESNLVLINRVIHSAIQANGQAPPRRPNASAACRTRSFGTWGSISVQPRRPAFPPASLDTRVGIVRPDQSPAKPDQPAIAAGVTGSKLQSQAGALRETQQDSALRRDAGVTDACEHLGERSQGGGKPGFVAGKGCEEAVRVPGIISGLRGEICNPRLGKFANEGDSSARPRPRAPAALPPWRCPAAPQPYGRAAPGADFHIFCPVIYAPPSIPSRQVF